MMMYDILQLYTSLLADIEWWLLFEGHFHTFTVSEKNPRGTALRRGGMSQTSRKGAQPTTVWNASLSTKRHPLQAAQVGQVGRL